MIRPVRRRLRVSLLLLLAQLAACGSTPPPAAIDLASALPQPSVPFLRDHGWSALAVGRHRDAQQHFERLLKAQPDDRDARIGLGEALLGQNRLDQAAQQFVRIGTDAPAALRARALQGQGIARLRQDQPAAAAPLLETAVGLDPKLWRAWNGLGRARDAARAWTMAELAYQRAIALQPNEASLVNNLGFSRLAAGDFAGAVQALNRALTLDPGLAAASNNLRLALALQGHYDQALVGVERPERAAALNNVGYGALLRGDLPEARALFLQALDSSPTFFEPARRNLTYLDGRDPAGAVMPPGR